jgi:O-antigen ligase
VAAHDFRMLDAALVAALAAAGLQLVPLPSAARLLLSPALAATDRALYLGAPEARAAAPLTVDPAASIGAFVLAAALALTFWSARAIFARGSIRRTVFTLAICGLAASALALAQHATAPRLLYWTWRPVNRNAFPYTPFVNRNDLAGWLVMGLPLATGYMLARMERRGRDGLLNLERALDPTGVWLTVAICGMAAGLAASLSRSGLIAGAAAAVALVWLSRDRMERRGRARLVASIGLLALCGIAYVNMGSLMTRVGETVAVGVGGRREIWRATLAVIHDFWRTGVGVGAYERAMSVYQPPHVFAFNHAHDEYLQMVCEGGVLVGLPVLAALAGGAACVVQQLRADRSPMYWIRAGAASALVAVGVQSLWETSLRMPANAVLFAICAAIAMHRPVDIRSASVSSERRRSAGG